MHNLLNCLHCGRDVLISAEMNSRQSKTLAAIFADPVSASIVWADIESLLKALGCTAKQGKGSAIQFERDGARSIFTVRILARKPSRTRSAMCALS